MQDQEAFASVLKALIQLDIDAVGAYEAALKHIDHPGIHAQIASFQADHERHIRDLSECLERYGIDAPETTADLKGLFIEGVTALRSLTGTEGAVKAMHSNEEMTNKQYAAAISKALPAEARQIVLRNFEDEKRHLRYIEDAIRTRPWEPARGRVAPVTAQPGADFGAEIT